MVIIEVDKINSVRPCSSFLKIEIELSEYQMKQAIKQLEAELKKENKNEKS